MAGSSRPSKTALEDRGDHPLLWLSVAFACVEELVLSCRPGSGSRASSARVARPISSRHTGKLTYRSSLARNPISCRQISERQPLS